MINQQIIDYIQKQIDKGISFDDIKVTLRRNGWQEDDINKALSSLPTVTETAEILQTNQTLPKKSDYKSNKFLKFLIYLMTFSIGVLVGLIIMFYIRNTNTQKCDTIDTTKTVKEDNTKTTVTTSPKDTYLSMKNEFDSITTVDQFSEYTLKYVTKAKMAEYNTMSSDSKNLSFNFIKELSPLSTDITTVVEKIDGTTSTLNVSTNDLNKTGTVTMQLEDNVWKLELESWSTTTDQ